MLFIVASPIGNLDDLSIRQAKTLTSSDIILAEDICSAHILLNACQFRFQLPKTNNQAPQIISYYKETEFEKLPEIVDLLKQGKSISMISQAGTPLLSDPGYLLVKSCVQRGLPLTIVPGASAATTALIYSGFNPGQHMFLGFFPKKESQIVQLIDKLKKIKIVFPEMVFIFYESPLRINKTLQLINQLKCDFEIVICREMTKKFEEIIREPTDKLIKRTYKGEITVVMK